MLAMQQRPQHQENHDLLPFMVTVMQPRLDDYADPSGWICTHAGTIHPLQKLDARKPLHRKAFPFFPKGITSTPTKAVDLYTVACMTIQPARINIHRNGWKR